MNKLAPYLDGVKTVGIAGHVNPDGDCVGSTLSMYLYLKQYYPNIRTDLYLEQVRLDFRFLASIEDARSEYVSGTTYDLFITVDTSTKDRIGVAADGFDLAKKTICIDHHVSNPGYADMNHIVPDASSASEVVFDLMEEALITKEIAEALYLGIVHDTGVFQYSCTSSHTMQIAGKLMDKGINFTKIIEETFFQKTYAQQKVLGKTLNESLLLLDGACIAGIVTADTMREYGITKADLDGIVSQLRLTAGVEAAIFLYEVGSDKYKVSLRSKSCVDVNKIASQFGGGGHVRAAGCTVSGTLGDIIGKLTECVEAAIQQCDRCE